MKLERYRRGVKFSGKYRRLAQELQKNVGQFKIE